MREFPTVAEKTAFVKPYADKYGLDLATVCAVIEQESGWYWAAVRYEPAFFARYIEGMRGLTDCEKSFRATSFGLMQIMGQVAREHGFSGSSLLELADPDANLEYGCKKLAECFRLSPDPEKALLHYNGGGNLEYGREVLARVAKYQGAA